MEAEQAGNGGRSLRPPSSTTDGSVTYYATYTAYSGSHISQQLLKTKDFQSFTSGPPRREADGANKGLALLFPRRITGRYAAMSRSDRRGPTRSPSPTIRPVWTSAVALPAAAVEAGEAQCNSEIAARQSKPSAGWLVLTHGVGPHAHTINIGAILLHLDDPTPGCSAGYDAHC